MIWPDNFVIFRTNCTILTTYIRANPRTCRGFSRGCCHVTWSNGDSCDILRLADFSQRWQGVRQGPGGTSWQGLRTRALICSCILLAYGKGEFSGLNTRVQFHAVTGIIRSDRASCKLTRMFLHLFCLKNIARKISTLVVSSFVNFSNNA